MDSKQAEIVEKYQEAKVQDEDVDDDELLELLDEDDGMLQQYRESRIEQLSKEFRRINDATSSDEFGNVVNVDNEKELMGFVSKTEFSIVHFYQPEFTKCDIMNQRLGLLAEKHLAIKVFSIKAENAPFLVNKLNVKVLPFVEIYRNGKELDRIVGFEKLGNNPSTFEYTSLESFLVRAGVINRKTINYASKKIVDSADDDDSDLDL